ncbi:SusC/RagA family TonB-linked outer membrane protein [Niabella aquatica]
MKSYLKKLLVLSFVLFAKLSFSQNKITGRVSDQSGSAIPGVVVTNASTQKKAVTNTNGLYEMQALPVDTLFFESISYHSASEVVWNREVIDVVLTIKDVNLEQVIVVGYGQQRKQSVVGAIAKVEGEALVQAGGVTNLSSALTGLAPGVTAIQVSGQPGSDQAQILIRGKATWGNTNPLILVDGIERDFNDVDPQEVENVSILKDASATAVFGVKGANGVILITTKRGRKGQVKISATTNWGVKMPTYKFRLLDHATAMELANEAQMNDKNWNYIFSGSYINKWRNKENPAYYPEIDWSKELLRKAGFSQQYNVNFAGGTDFVKYFTSLGYTRDGDIFKTEKQSEYDPAYRFTRYNYRSNLDFTITKTTTISTNFAGNIGVRQAPNTYQGRDAWDSWGAATQFKQMYTVPNYVFPVRYPNGQWGNNPANRWDNLVFNLNQQGNGIEKLSQMFSDLILKQDLGFITAGLSLQGKLSYNSSIAYRRTITKNVISYYYNGPLDTNPQVFPDYESVNKPASFGGENLSNDYRNLYYELSGNYNRKFKKHNVGLMGLFFRRQDYNNTQFTAYQESWVGRATYSFDNKYLFEFNGAYNGSEKFAPGLRFGFFPSYAVGWVISEERFIKNNLPVINYLKARYSYGKVGSDIGAPRFTYTTDYSSGGTAPFGEASLTWYGPMYFEGAAANRNATWETSTKQNLGIELRLLHKLSFNAEFYEERRSGILMTRRTIPIWFGAGNPSANIGATKNHGYELEAAWDDKIGDVSYGIKANYTFNENRVIFRDDPANVATYQKEAGKPIGWNSMLLQEGLYNSWDDIYNWTASSWNSGLIPGDFKYVDYNGDGIIDAQDFVAKGKLSYPAHTYGLTLSAGYKGFAINAMFYGVSGIDLAMPYELLWEFPGNNAMAWPYSVNRWTPETAFTATRPSLHMTTTRTHNAQNSTFGFADASYWRLKTMELSYRFTSGFMNKLRNGAGLQMYFNGNNLLTWSSFDDRIDPESANSGAYPIVRRYNLGMRISL